ncbi:MAG: META domain-containing protein [Candidatus Electronema sp. V4]|uniref:META domain-containing protein n=1 Tax=Candidatus Electronema sp. V4 TaxID=3454756 RepID=UPI0040554A42
MKNKFVSLRTSAAVLCCAAVLLTSGCSKKGKELIPQPAAPPRLPATSADSGTLNDTVWLLETLRGQAKQPGSSVTLYFENGQAKGTAGCNSYFGPYVEEKAGQLHLKQVTLTKRLCQPPELMEQERRVAEALKAAATFTLTGGRLTLKDRAGGTAAVFKAQSQELRGTMWQAVSFSDGLGGIKEVLRQGRMLTAAFSADGQLTGSGGCNSYHARCAAPSASRSFSFEMTMMETKQCPSDVIMEQEGQFMAAFYTAASFRIEGRTMTLRDADGNPAVIFSRL